MNRGHDARHRTAQAATTRGTEWRKRRPGATRCELRRDESRLYEGGGRLRYDLYNIKKEFEQYD